MRHEDLRGLVQIVVIHIKTPEVLPHSEIISTTRRRVRNLPGQST